MSSVAKTALINALEEVYQFRNEDNKDKERYKIFERRTENVLEDLFANDASFKCIRALATSVSELILIENLAKFGVTISNSSKILERPKKYCYSTRNSQILLQADDTEISHSPI